MTFQSMIKEQENKTAEIVGQQIKQLGNSVNSYIAVHYDKLSTLSIETVSFAYTFVLPLPINEFMFIFSFNNSIFSRLRY